MLYNLLADSVLILHVAFVVFVLIGGMLALKWPWIVRLHVPAVFWGAFVECSGWLCPLTPLENWLREQAGSDTYETDFLSRYLLPMLYPAGLNRSVQLVLGSMVILINVAVYALIWRRRTTMTADSPSASQRGQR